MTFDLAAHISYGVVGGRALILDLAADRYFWLDNKASALLSAIASGQVQACDQPLARTPMQRGWIVAQGTGHTGPVIAPPIETSALEETGPARRIGFLECARRRVGAQATLRRHGLAALVAQLRFARSATLQTGLPDPAVAAELARGYAATRIAVPLRRRCIADSVALLQCLWSRGLDADLYFGARCDPFAAHCWLQNDTQVLTDPCAVVGEFTPVFRL